MPARIQLSRAKGWRKPESAIVVARPTIYGNPFPVDIYGQEGATDRFRRLLLGRMSCEEMSQSSTCTHMSLTQTRTVIRGYLPKLRGHDLACWCKLPAEGEPDHCHAAVLLELANT
ncbi:DUF4326 domain-containing protein [Methylobacterium organophilum]|uniref:DUF4326 domain-containing protein n=1 Tax=Methylobacterium TaxID=407 RepID=UPI0019CF5271|nr:DUF4326 domain-containing protein [Methylobacterium organophilum]MBN6819564.1 DUF4326 domain-containing protein [Methylobacterium organophilum]